MTRVTAGFLRLVQADAITQRRRLIVVIAIALLSAVVAVLLHPLSAAVFVGIWFIAGLAGFSVGRGQTRNDEASLRDDWVVWMESTYQVSSLHELRHRPFRWPLAFAFWAAITAAWLFGATDTGLLQSLPFAVVTGSLGALAGLVAARLMWSRKLFTSLNEMLDDGELEAI